MSVAAEKPYKFESADRLENFHGQQLLYIGWHKHLLFNAPFCFVVAPDQTFEDMIANVLTPAIAYHPQTAEIDWSQVRWCMSGKPFTPDPKASLAANGIGHKTSLRFETPGLPGIWSPQDQ